MIADDDEDTDDDVDDDDDDDDGDDDGADDDDLNASSLEGEPGLPASTQRCFLCLQPESFPGPQCRCTQLSSRQLSPAVAAAARPLP